MSQQTITVKTPGKLMVAGEFAVLEPNHHLITMAVNRFVYVTLKDSIDNTLHLTDYHLNNIEWNYENGKIDVNSTDKRMSFVKEALYISYTYLNEKGIYPSHCSISIKSELADESGIKYGLGSSAAVVTALITAILSKNLPEQPEKELIFKLASLTHVNVQGNGSGADIAASTYGGMVLYSSFQAEWLIEQYKNCHTITELIEKEWTYLSIKRLNWPANFHIRIGWTGSPASTGSLVKQVLKLKINDQKHYSNFLNDSETAVQQIANGIDNQDFELLLNGVRKNRTALASLGKLANVDIETEKLFQLSQLAEQFNGAGKLSGAGGGDCGIAFVPTEELGNKLNHRWEKHNIKPLSLTIDSFGTKTI